MDPDILNRFGEIIFEELEMSSLTRFCHPAISQFSMAAVSFVIACKELKIGQIAQINQLFQLLNLICSFRDVFSFCENELYLYENINYFS